MCVHAQECVCETRNGQEVRLYESDCPRMFDWRSLKCLKLLDQCLDLLFASAYLCVFVIGSCVCLCGCCFGD